MIDIRMPSTRVMAFLITAPFVVVACAGSVAESESDTAAAETTPVVEVTPGDAETGITTEQPAEPGGWLDIELTDAITGETFTLASLEGEVVAIEPMAIWCSNCKAQQNNVKEAYSDIAEAGVTYISLGIDPGENEDALARYADRNGFGWTFVKSPNEFSRELSDLFGPQILSAPSTPLIVLGADGEVFTQEWGFHNPDSLLGILDEAADAA